MLAASATVIGETVMRVILFDIDGTLITTGGAGRDALHTALATEFAVSDPYQIDLSGRTDRGICRELFEAHDIPHTPENWERFRNAYLVGLNQHLQTRPGRVLPGVRELVAGLKTMPRVALGLLTGNVRDGARRKLSHYALDEHFVFGGFGDTPLDVRCARAIGAKVVAVATGSFTVDELHVHQPDVVVEDLGQTLEMLEVLVGER